MYIKNYETGKCAISRLKCQNKKNDMSNFIIFGGFCAKVFWLKNKVSSNSPK